MKSIIPRSVRMATIIGLTATFIGCGGASGDTANTEDTAFNEMEVVGDRADLATTNSDIDYNNLFNGINNTENYDILELAEMEQNFSIFTRLAKLSQLDLKLNYTDDITVFIPTNDAFQQMPEEEFEKLVDPRNKAQLAKFLQRHVLPNEVNSVDFNSSQAIETSSEEEIIIDTNQPNLIYIGGAQIVKSDIEASDGTIHIVNSIIEPSRDVFAD